MKGKKYSPQTRANEINGQEAEPNSLGIFSIKGRSKS
jgi:hypothetical protein